MKVIQILGPSYCGSTVLGYALNTIDGFFFASEARRHLKTFREKSGKGYPICDYCGEDCKYWSRSFLEETSDIDSLNYLYEEFSKRNPNIDFFVDGSKLLSSYADTKAYKRIICVKHPFKMLASYLYNSRSGTSVDVSSYSSFKDKVDEFSDDMLMRSKKYLLNISNVYRSFYDFDAKAFLFKSDEAHLNNMALFDDLLIYLEVKDKNIDVLNFSKYICHSLGGNRAPVHLMKKEHKLKTSSNQRFQYYDRTTSFGDWKVDDKYKELLSESFISLVENTSEYKKSLKTLGYSD